MSECNHCWHFTGDCLTSNHHSTGISVAVAESLATNVIYCQLQQALMASTSSNYLCRSEQ